MVQVQACWIRRMINAAMFLFLDVTPRNIMVKCLFWYGHTKWQSPFQLDNGARTSSTTFVRKVCDQRHFQSIISSCCAIQKYETPVYSIANDNYCSLPKCSGQISHCHWMYKWTSHRTGIHLAPSLYVFATAILMPLMLETIACFN